MFKAMIKKKNSPYSESSSLGRSGQGCARRHIDPLLLAPHGAAASGAASPVAHDRDRATRVQHAGRASSARGHGQHEVAEASILSAGALKSRRCGGCTPLRAHRGRHVVTVVTVIPAAADWPEVCAAGTAAAAATVSPSSGVLCIEALR